MGCGLGDGHRDLTRDCAGLIFLAWATALAFFISMVKGALSAAIFEDIPMLTTGQHSPMASASTCGK